MPDYADLEIGLYRQEADRYTVALRFRQPDTQADRTPQRGLAHLDLDDLRQYAAQPEEYGRRLGLSLFADAAVRAEFDGAQTAAEARDRPLRLRLFIDRSAPELHAVPWETLRDPKRDTSLTTNERLLFSRFLSTSDWRPMGLRPKGHLRALTVIANPEGLADPAHPYVIGGRQLGPVDVAGELDRARQALGATHTGELCSAPDVPSRVSLASLVNALREGYDILYLVCHGALLTGVDPPGPYLYLENEQGRVHCVAGTDLVARLRDLDPAVRPRLVVLASCQSAGAGIDATSSDRGALAAIGPRLAQDAGIPAVLAMQGNVFMETVARFMPVFFEQLRTHGQIDQAMAAARGTILDRPDWWAPVLFMRLRHGCLWYEPYLAAAEPEADPWPDLLAAIRGQRCTPIIGPGLIEFLLGSPQEVAQRWAEAESFPMAPHSCINLPCVARYLATMRSPLYPVEQLKDYMRQELQKRHEDELAGQTVSADLERQIRVVGEKHRQADEAEPFRVLARLPVSIFVTATHDSLLYDALREVNKEPRYALCPWKEHIEQPDPAFREDPSYAPTPQQPLVYHLYGHLSQQDSLVISEDDYFDYLMWVSQDRTRGEQSQIPTSVSGAWTRNALVFLGFGIDDWDFRVLLHSIINPEAGSPPRRPRSVAVQIGPEEGRFLRPGLARRYLEKYFSHWHDVIKTNIYWGTAQDFLRELWQHREWD